MVYTIYLWWFGGWFILVLTTLYTVYTHVPIELIDNHPKCNQSSFSPAMKRNGIRPVGCHKCGWRVSSADWMVRTIRKLNHQQQEFRTLQTSHTERYHGFSNRHKSFKKKNKRTQTAGRLTDGPSSRGEPRGEPRGFNRPGRRIEISGLSRALPKNHCGAGFMLL